MSSRYGLEIRSANEGDAAGLSELLAEMGSVVAPAEVAERLVDMRGRSATILIAVTWGPPSGLIELHAYRTLAAPRGRAQVTLLYVARDARRGGVGRSLLKSASQWARSAGCDGLELRVEAAEPSLRGFAEATGFEKDDRLFTRPLRKRA